MFCHLRAPTFVVLHDLRISFLYSHFDGFYDFSYCIINSYFRTIAILVQDMEKFQQKQSFATLGHPHLLYYMTFEFQLYVVGCIINSYFRTITILVQNMEKFHFKQSFATLGHPHLLYYMTFVFQLYIVILMVFMIFLIA